MSQKKFTKDHEWIAVDGNEGTVGITDYAQNALGDLVYIELPKTGAKFSKGDEAAVVESVKAASEVYAPAGGEVTAVNDKLPGDPGLVNSSPEKDAWLFKIKLADKSELDDLMDEAAYKKYIESL